MNMSRTKSILAAAVLGAIAFAGAAQAATVTVTPSVARYFATPADALAGANSPIPANNGKAGVYEIAYKVGTALDPADTAAGFTGLGNAFWDAIAQGQATLPAHLTVNSDFGSGIYDLGMKYNGAGTRYTYTDPVTGAQVTGGSGLAAANNLYSTVADLGTAGDFKSYSVALATGVYPGTDPKFTATQSSQSSTYTGLVGNPPSIFEVFMNFDGLGNATLQTSANPATEGFGLHNNTTGLTTFFPAGTPGQNYVLAPLAFTVGTVPEPTTLGLLAIGSLMALRRRQA